MATILFDARWIGPHGIGRVAEEYRKRLATDFTIVDINLKSKPSSPMDMFRTARAFSRSNADIFVSPGYNGSPWIGRRQVFFVHDLTHIQFDNRKVWLKRIFYDTFIRNAAARAAAVVTVSNFARDQIASRWPECAGKLHVLPNGISDVFAGSRPAAAGTAPRSGLVMFCNNRWHKNLGTMLAGLAELRRDDPQSFAALSPITLVGSCSAEVEELLSRNGLADCVQRAGAVDDAGLAAIYRRARGLLFCSLSEGFGLPIVEAIACGTAVVCSDIPAFREIAGPNCIYVDPRSTREISSALRRIATTEAVSLPHEVDGILRRFNWNSSYAQLKAIIEDALTA